MPTETKTLEMIKSLEQSKQFLVDDKIVLSDEQVTRELDNRVAIENELAYERQKELDQMFPNRTSGNLYQQLQQPTDTFDF